MYNKLTTKAFINTAENQSFAEKNLIDALNSVHNNAAFSIFPYVFDQLDSKKTIKQTLSGNCIALSIYLKNLLKESNIKSYLIQATVPNRYKQPYYLDISHVALAVIGNNKIYILDAAFYFDEPMRVPI